MSASRMHASLAAAFLCAAVAADARAQGGLFGDAVFGPQPTLTDNEETRAADGVDLGEGVPIGEWMKARERDRPEAEPLVAPLTNPNVPEPADALTDLEKYPLLPADDDLLMPQRRDPEPTLRRPAGDPDRFDGTPDWVIPGDVEDAPDVELLPAPTRRQSDKPPVDDLLMEGDGLDDAGEDRSRLAPPLLIQPRGRQEYNPLPILPKLPDPSETGPAAPDSAPPVRTRTLRPQPATAGTPEGVRLAIGGRLLDTLFRNEQRRCGDVNDCILGARVRGRQQTRTRTSLRLQPCEEAARFEVVLSGRTLSETSGSTSVAAVRSAGDHTFEMVKPFRFDGDTLQTATPAATVWPQQTTLAATPLRGRVPVIGRVVGRMAFEEAERRKPAVERIAADRLTKRVAGQFNGSVDGVLSRLQTVWDDSLLERLERVLPDAKRPTARTTSTHAVFKLPTPNAYSADPPAGWPEGSDGVSLAIHESAAVAALDRLSLGGRELPQGNWDGLVDRLLPNARIANKPAGGEDLSSLGTLRLADADPVSVRFDGGRAEVIVRGVIVTPIGETSVQRITIPWTVSADAESVFLEPGEPTVVADEPDARGDLDAALMDRVRDLVERTVSEEMRSVRLRRSAEFPVSDRRLRLSLKDLRLRNGWLILSWDADLASA